MSQVPIFEKNNAIIRALFLLHNFLVDSREDDFDYVFLLTCRMTTLQNIARRKKVTMVTSSFLLSQTTMNQQAEEENL